MCFRTISLYILEINCCDVGNFVYFFFVFLQPNNFRLQICVYLGVNSNREKTVQEKIIMKQLILKILIFITLGNLPNEETFAFESNLFQVSSDIQTSDSLKQKFVPIIQGVWVLTDYISEIEKTKSSLKSRNKLTGDKSDVIAALVIDTANQTDSIEIGASVNNHEELFFIIYFQTGQNKNQLKTNISYFDEKSNFHELGYEIINNITYLFLYHYDKTNNLIGKTQFSKVVDKQKSNDVAWGIQYMVNEKLFSGNFTLIDSRNTKIKFNADGSLTGFLNFKTYHILTDYAGAAIIPDIDMISFRNDENWKLYAFRVIKDTIFLYSVIFNEEVGEAMTSDKLKYKLVRE